MTLISHTSHLLNLHNELKFEDEFKKSNLLRNPTNVECICIKMYVVDDIKCEGPPLEIVIDVSKKTQLPYSDERTNVCKLLFIFRQLVTSFKFADFK